MNLYVGNLNPDTTVNQLRDAFGEFGTVVVAKIIRDPLTGMPKGFGFVEMADKTAAFDAIDNLDGAYLAGNIVTVKEAKSDKGKKPVPRQGFNKGYRSSGGGDGTGSDLQV
jgi:RNA recognition motif-containing protein